MTDSDTDTVSYEHEQFDQTDASAAGEGQAGAGAGATGGLDGLDHDLRRLGEVPLEMSVEIGRTQMTVGDTLDLRAGSIVTLDRLAGEPVDLLVNGTPIARGEVVVVDEQFGLRVTEILEGDGTTPPADDEDADMDAGAEEQA
jgi:flagellar motor switch protein FliN/FliY